MISCKGVVIERAELYIGDHFVSEVIKPGGPDAVKLNFLGELPINCGKLYTEFATVTIITDDNETPELSWEEVTENMSEDEFVDSNGYKTRLVYTDGTAYTEHV
jgi:hypothetical protein